MIYPFSRLFLGNFIQLYIRKVEGVENIPKNVPFIMAANHSSYIDDLILPYTMLTKTNKRFHIFANSRFYKNFFLIKFLDHYQCISVDVAKDVTDDERRRRTNESAFKEALHFLRKGDVFGIFPEGGRSKDGKLSKAKTGVAKVALTAKVPVLPVGIKGSYEIMPKGAKFPRFKRAEIIIGKPLYFDKYYGKVDDYKVLEEVSNSIMKKIAGLINQEYEH